MLRSTPSRLFKAVVAHKDGCRLEEFADYTALPAQDAEANVLVKVTHSTLNYKDAMALAGRKGVSRFPVVAGIDAAGVVVRGSAATATQPALKEGDEVVITGNKIGQNVDGGLSEYLHVQSGWCVQRPEGLTLWDTMAMGSAGFTAMMCIQHLEQHADMKQFRNTDVPILVTGAGGGLGGIAVSFLRSMGYTVVASTRREELREYLIGLGATEVIGALGEVTGPLGKQKWGGVIDAVGGTTLVKAVTQTRYRCGIASTGVAAGGDMTGATVFPYILRGLRLLGVDSTLPYTSQQDAATNERYLAERMQVWEEMVQHFPHDALKSIVKDTIPLEAVTQDVAAEILGGNVRGRYVVSCGSA